MAKFMPGLRVELEQAENQFGYDTPMVNTVSLPTSWSLLGELGLALGPVVLRVRQILSVIVIALLEQSASVLISKTRLPVSANGYLLIHFLLRW
jgi:hypothetical protein